MDYIFTYTHRHTQFPRDIVLAERGFDDFELVGMQAAEVEFLL